ncbi:hypothetical protein [Pararhodobacter oceanensis]|uniref:hypothetical protein n=1 Tax=Pararhodobacter oceanensis TaxID=2172121 RepID=UPI003A92E347
MRQALVIAGVILTLALPAAPPAKAQGCADPDADCGRIGDLMSDLLERIDPFMGALAELLGDYSGWHMPEVLPNGDILIRRRDLSPPEAEEGAEEDAPVLDPLEL